MRGLPPERPPRASGGGLSPPSVAGLRFSRSPPPLSSTQERWPPPRLVGAGGTAAFFPDLEEGLGQASGREKRGGGTHGNIREDSHCALPKVAENTGSGLSAIPTVAVVG